MMIITQHVLPKPTCCKTSFRLSQSTWDNWPWERRHPSRTSG